MRYSIKKKEGARWWNGPNYMVNANDYPVEAAYTLWGARRVIARRKKNNARTSKVIKYVTVYEEKDN